MDVVTSTGAGFIRRIRIEDVLTDISVLCKLTGVCEVVENYYGRESMVDIETSSAQRQQNHNVILCFHLTIKSIINLLAMQKTVLDRE